MKALYLILCVCFAVFVAIESTNTVKKYHEELKNRQNENNACRNASGLTFEFLENFNKTDEEMGKEELEQMKYKIGCYLSCLLQERGIMNGTTIHFNQLTDLMTQDADSSEEKHQAIVQMIVGVVEGCKKQIEKMTDICSIGWTFFSCMGDIVGL